jgi:hypothetical protein
MLDSSKIGRTTFSSKPFNGVKVFSATMVGDRGNLGERVTEWLQANPEFEVCEIVVTQSSDEAFHCLALTVFYWEPL